MSDDLIRRSDAIKAIWGKDINPSEEGMVFEAQSHIDRDIRLIPSADRPSGEWIDKGKNLWKCSNCEMVIYSESEQDRNELHKWCSRCGARMKGVSR